MTAMVLALSFSIENLPSVGPCWSSCATTRNAVLKPCSVYFGLVDEGDIWGIPASE
ncbi:hypothetical protein D3C83_18670 [compost metagenome]